MKKLGLLGFMAFHVLNATVQDKSALDSLFPLTNDAQARSCQMKSATAPGNRLVANRNGAASASMPGQCMGNALMHQMLLAGADFSAGPEMSEAEVQQKLQGLKAGKPQTFTGVKNISELSEKHSATLKQFADKLQIKSFYSPQRLGMGVKLLTGMSKSTGSASDLERMYKLTQAGKRPVMVLGQQGAVNAHVVLVDKIEKKGSMYAVTYADSNLPGQASTMQCSADGNCETQMMGNQKAFALKGSEEARSFAMAGQRCQADRAAPSTSPASDQLAETGRRPGSHI